MRAYIGIAAGSSNFPGGTLTLLGPQSRFGDKLLKFRVFCPHIWECGAKGDNAIRPIQPTFGPFVTVLGINHCLEEVVRFTLYILDTLIRRYVGKRGRHGRRYLS